MGPSWSWGRHLKRDTSQDGRPSWRWAISEMAAPILEMAILRWAAPIVEMLVYQNAQIASLHTLSCATRSGAHARTPARQRSALWARRRAGRASSPSG